MTEEEQQGSMEPQTEGIDLILDIPLEDSVQLGRTRMPIQQLLGLAPGSVIDLDKLSGEPLDILLNNRLVARGKPWLSTTATVYVSLFLSAADQDFGLREVTMSALLASRSRRNLKSC